jgi:hypothetical protein
VKIAGIPTKGNQTEEAAAQVPALMWQLKI